MLRAEQLALIQEANQQLLAIRRQEMDYYVATFSSFGTQAALIAGFTLGALTGLDAESFSVADGWRAVFWISTAIAMASSIHCVLTTTFANIYGPNLALRGPSGSMVRAVKGMIAEKGAIFTSFIIALIAFQAMTLATTWIVMKTYASAACTAILLVGGMYWYKYCLRIYNRFKFIEPDIEWKDDERQNAPVNDQPITESHALKSDISSPENSTNFNAQRRKSTDKKSIFRMPTRSTDTDNNMNALLVANAGGGNSSSHVWMEGYMSKESNTKNILSSDSWNRRFFVLKESELYYYKSREDFESDPSKSIKNRPISVVGYQVRSLSNGHPPYIFELRPDREGDDRRVWKLMCDTLDEMNLWINAFNEAISQSS